MLFTWEYLLFVLAGLFLYYTYFKKFPLAFFNTVSLLFIAYLDWPSAIAVIGFSYLTYYLYQLSNSWYSKLGVAFHLLAWLLIKSGFIWQNAHQEQYINIEFLGFSYFILQNISLLLSENKPPISFMEVLMGNAFFSKFSSGPIYTHVDFFKTKFTRNFIESNIASGIQRILFGFFKKLVLADRLGLIVNNVFDEKNPFFNGFSLLFGTVLFTIQMYLDFSAYSDIAIGTGRLFGLNFKENFKLPLRSASVSEYWRKTHMTLINWLSIHIYYPIVYKWRKNAYLSVVFALLITFSLSGIWHGLNVGYLFWGILNALYLMIEFTGKKIFKINNTIRWIGIPVTILLVSFANFFFKAATWEKIQNLILQAKNHSFFPQDWMVEFVAIIGNGGHFIQQYNLLETSLLLSLFLIFEPRLEKFSRNEKFSINYLILVSLGILFFGSFNSGLEFIYVQF